MERPFFSLERDERNFGKRESALNFFKFRQFLNILN